MRIAVAMSGGVDSSVAAMLLRRAGHDLFGLFLRNGVEVAAGEARSCCSASDARDARAVAHDLGIPFHAIDASPEFGRLIERFVEAYREGRTPNPCAGCNREIKFGALFDLARSLGADAIATGHYARVETSGGRARLRRGADRTKDQSYQLFALPAVRLARVNLPLGGRSKEEVRALARAAGLPVAEKPDSQDLCFVPGGDYRRLLAERGVRGRPGPVVDDGGTEVGRHDGIEAFTVGQRRGLPALPGGPRFVVALDAASATVVVATRERARRDAFAVSGTNWIGRDAPAAAERIRATVQVRSRHAGAAGTVEGVREGRAVVRLDQAEGGVSPGQAAVFYEGDEVLGGGWIEPADRTGSPCGA